MNRPVTTLFMLMSVDGKISTGAVDEMDVDRDFPKIEGVKEGLHQYYEIEQTTDLWSFNTGRVQAKMGVNEKEIPSKRRFHSYFWITGTSQKTASAISARNQTGLSSSRRIRSIRLFRWMKTTCTSSVRNHCHFPPYLNA